MYQTKQSIFSLVMTRGFVWAMVCLLTISISASNSETL